MAFVTRLRLTSGDRAVLDRVVDGIKETAERKGAELKGPHSRPPTKLSVPQHKRCPPEDGDRFDDWRYTVYEREVDIVGHDSFARDVARQGFPSSVNVEVEVDRRSGLGG
jgi:ribosomal protein S10